MKKTLATTALILATLGSTASAQGMEGHRTGYNDQHTAGISYVAPGSDIDADKVEIFRSGTFRAEDLTDVTITAYPAPHDKASVNRFPR